MFHQQIHREKNYGVIFFFYSTEVCQLLTMRKLFLSLAPLFIFSFLLSCNKRSGNPRVLLFSKTAGFVHPSIPTGIEAIRKLGQSNEITVDTTGDATHFN